MARNEKQNRRPVRENRAPAYIAWHVAGNEDKAFWKASGYGRNSSLSSLR